MHTNAVRYTFLCFMLVIILPISVFGEAPKTQTEPSVNVVFLDDRATGLPDGIEIRLNDWSRWERRLPTFIDLLSMIGSFRRGRSEGVDGSATVFGVELAESLSSERRKLLLTDILRQIQAKTKRPSAILGRSTKGSDQLRFIVQDSIDYTPEFAVTFLEALSDISPLIPPETLGANFGPFIAPPTFIFDPLFPPAHVTSDDSSRAVRRWALLEETYLLPHYVLHAIAVVNANTSLLRSTFYPHSSPEPGTTIGAARLSNVYIAGAGINSSVDRGQTDVLRMALARARPNPIVVTVDLGEWAQRGLTFDNPRTATELQTVASMYTRQGQAQGRDVIFDVRSGSDPYLLDRNLPRGVDIVDYMGRATKWKSDSTLQAMAFDSIVSVAKDTQPLGKTYLMAHSEAAWSVGKMRGTPDRLEIYKGRVGPDMIIPVVQRVMEQGGESLLFTGKNDFWSLWNLSTKSVAQDVCTRTGCTAALHDLTARGIIDHGLPLGERPFEVVSAGGRNRLQLDPTAFTGHSLDQKYSREPGGILFDKGNAYTLDVSGVVRMMAEKAAAAVGESGGVSGVFESGGKTHLAVGIPVGTAKPTLDRITTPVGRFLAVDYRTRNAGSLPLALPRLWAKGSGIPIFGGGWTFEALVAQGISEFAGQRREEVPRVTIQVFETGNELRYNRHESGNLPADTATTYVPEGGAFWPDLLHNHDGSYSFRLRHGVTVILDRGGLIKALTSPRGERIDYVRSTAQSLQRQEMSSQSFAIELLGQNPQRVVAAKSEKVRYGYLEGRLAEISAGQRRTLLSYGSSGVLASVEKDSRVLKMQSTGDGSLWRVSGNGIEATTSSRPRENALEFSASDRITTIWRLGPRQRVAGVITQGHAVLWTRTSEGRIMQMAIGTLTPKEDAYEFVPLAVAGASP